MDSLKAVLRIIFRFIVVWVVDTLSLIVTSVVIPGISITSQGSTPAVIVAVSAALVLGIVNLLIRPIILLLALPFGFFVIFGVGFVVNAIVLMITANILPGFHVDSWLSAFIGGIFLAAINTIFTTVLTVDDDDSFYQGIVERLAKRDTFKDEDFTKRGLVMLEIDGLSYHHIQKALADGYMPTLKQMMNEEGYQLSRIDCGLPSQTSACQAGIMFGDNYDIPAFRWYDKDLKKLMVSSKDAALLNERYAHGSGLMRGGSSINNMMNGDANKSILTLADFKTGSPEEKKRRAQDIYLLMLNPYFFMRVVVLFLADAVREVYEGWQQRRRNVRPRLDRLEHFYPFVRAATTSLMRDISAYLVTLDIVRGTPSLYTTYVGYDEVAHHSGPWTTDAFKVLRQYDHVVKRTRDIIDRKAPRPYDLIILSDHGQSFGATFKQRYGKSLKETIEELMPAGTTVSQSTGGDDGMLSVTAMAGELDNIQQQGVGGRTGRAVVSQAQVLAQRGMAEQGGAAESAVPTTVTAYGSGNLAQVYFDLFSRKIKLSELNAAYPGMVDGLQKHEGVGLIVAYEDDGTPAAFGKKGARNLHTGKIVGEDPLKMYGDPELRAEQVRRIADFPHSGDLTVISTVYPDGTVAALEELIGSHGGIGGEQTDAFIFHPADMPVSPTKNSADVFHILNARRDQPAALPKPQVKTVTKEADAWSPANLGKGLSQVGKWMGLAARSVVLDRDAYREVVRDILMTGPALLIAIVTSAIASIALNHGFNIVDVLARIVLWLAGVLIIFGAGRVLGGKGSFTTTLRGVGFAQSAFVFELLNFIPPLAPLARFLTLVVTFFATWLGAVEAQQLRGWRGFLLPVAAVAVLVIGIVVIAALVAGAQFTLQGLSTELGITPAP